MKKKILSPLFFAAAILLAATPVLAAQPPAKQPNILVIMGDDIGMWNIGAYHRGMLVGGVTGYARDQQQSAQQAQQTQYSQTAAMQQFQNAESACLRGRGYTVGQ